MYAYASIKPTTNNQIVINAIDKGERLVYPQSSNLPIDGQLDLIKAIYNRLVIDFKLEPLSFELTTIVDAPPGSGLGSSSTLVVAIIGAFVEWLKLPLGEYDIAHLAFSIEREDLAMAGGKQDQYAATFGGVNFMEFYKNDKVIVNPLRIKDKHLYELENNLILFFTETSRVSSEIIEKQRTNVTQNNEASISAMHNLKEQAIQMKEALLKGEVDMVGEILHFGWMNKRKMADGISNSFIDNIYDTALNAGATGGKISGAGGGGFMIFYAPENNKYNVIKSLNKLGGKVMRYTFTDVGLTSWTAQLV
jgi:D-glycero-alpha-D-manno-heptose-7-phosphate kinase